MKKISAIALSLLTATTVGAHANTFQSEVGFVSTSVSYDTDYDSVELDTMSIGGLINFSSIDVGSYPFNEASFLSHSSNVSFNISDTDETYSSFYGYDDEKYSTDYQFVELNMVVPDSNMIWGVALEDTDYGFNVSDSITSLKIGSYATPTSIVHFKIVTGDRYSVVDVTGFGFGMKNVTVNSDGTATSLMFSVDQEKYSIDGSSVSDKSTFIDFEGAYYLSQKTNISFKLSVVNGELLDLDAKTFTFGLKSFVAPNFSIQASMGKTSYSDSYYSDDDIISFGASFRF